MIKKGLVAVLVVLSCASVTAQRSGIYEQYNNDISTINPASINSLRSGVISFFYNRQMINVPGAPENIMVNFALPIPNKKAGFGMNFAQEKAGLVSVFNGYLSYCYTMPLRKWNVSTGFSMGLLNQRLNLSEKIIVDDDDPIVRSLQDASRANKIDLRVGLMLNNDKWTAGVSVKRILSPTFDYSYFTYYGDVKLFYVGQFHAAYKHQINANTVFVPSILITQNRDLNTPIQLNMSWILNNKFWMGAYMSTPAKFGLNFGATVNEVIKLGYSVSNSFNASKSLGSNHEAYVSISLAGNADQGPRDEHVVEKMVIRRDTVFVDNTGAKNVPITVNPAGAIPEGTKTEPSAQVNPNTAGSTVKTSSIKINKDTVTVSSIDDIKTLKSGMDTSKLKFENIDGLKPQPGYYVVVGVFSIQKNADNYIRQNYTKGIKSYKFYSESNKYFYVYVYRSDDLDEAEEVKQTGEYDVNDIWIKRVGRD